MTIAYLPRQLLIGEGTFEKLPEQLALLAIKKPFIIFSGSALKTSKDWLANQLTAAIFYQMPTGEPTLDMLADACNKMVEAHCDSVIAIGGGSAIDLAKAVTAQVSDPQTRFADFAQKTKINRCPLITVPTTAGTGSEATKVTVITDTDKGIKLNPGHPDLIPDLAILDPVLTTAMPQHITAFTGLDALTHAIEAYVSTNASIVSDLYALEAVKLISHNLETVYHEPFNIQAREQMLLGSYYAGIAFSNASTNLAHATGRALGVKFKLPHGQSVALMHPFVVTYSMASSKERYRQIAQVIGLSSEEGLSSYLVSLNERLGVWASARHLAQVLDADAIEVLTTMALSGNGILTNRRVPHAEDVSKIYEELRKVLQNKGGK